MLLIIPVGFATADAAYQDALDQAPGADTLVNFEGRADHLFIFPFYFEVCAQVHGWAVSSSQLTAHTESKTQADEYVGYWRARWAERPAIGAWAPDPIASPTF